MICDHYTSLLLQLQLGRVVILKQSVFFSDYRTRFGFQYDLTLACCNSRELDHEEKRDHEIILTLTDGNLGVERYITQSLLILVEDANDNPPVFSPPQISVEVAEHVSNLVLATLTASDRDSGAFGQVR